ncbi:hypothetical protein TNCV_4629561 [Trichonephila clavipes]|nr:hypothetical protein TNCV_4629561 [Trichonephila clavipes]
MTAQWYVHDILQPQVLSLMPWLPGAIFQQDNARPPTVKFEPLTILLRWYFIDLTEASQRPPKDGALGGINFHSIPSADKKPAKLSSESSISFRNLLSSLLAPTNVFPLSEYNLAHLPLRLKNLLM